MTTKIVIDPGHGGNDPGSSGAGIQEKNINLDIALNLKRILVEYAEVKLTRESDIFISLGDRSALANNYGADLFMSIHVNAGGGTGFESFIYSYAKSETDTIRQVIHKATAAFYSGKGFPDRGMKRANFAVLRETLMPALLLENLFIDNPVDVEKLKDAEFRKHAAEAIAQGVITALKLTKTVRTPILGTAKAAANQIKKAIAAQNPQADISIVDYYYLYSPKYGIAPDLAVSQAIKETGWFKFTGLVKAWQNNFAGIGATGEPANGKESLNGADSRVVRYQPGVHGAVFEAKEWGVKAHLQHLFAYASKLEQPGEILVDPRFIYVPRGIAPNFEDLNGRWAVPGSGYGEGIVAIRDKIVNDYPENETPGDCDIIKQENTGLKAQISLLQAENTAIRTENTQVLAENATLKAENTRLVSENASLKATVGQLQAENAALKDKIIKAKEILEG